MVAVAGAIGQALELVSAPAGLQEARGRDFPDDMTAMLRLVAGDAATLEQAVIESNETEESIREAAEFFVLQVCFTPGIDSYRVLGVNRDEPTARIREHYRLLVRWLHPDRNSDAWQTVYLDRVNKAWRDLRDPESRAEYDRLGPDHEEAEAADPVNKMPMGVAAASTLAVGAGKRVSARTMRQLPTVVMAGLGVFAAVVLALMYADYQADRQARHAVSPAPVAPAGQSDQQRARSAKPMVQTASSGSALEPEPAAPGDAQIDADSNSEPVAAVHPEAAAAVVSVPATADTLEAVVRPLAAASPAVQKAEPPAATLRTESEPAATAPLPSGVGEPAPASVAVTAPGDTGPASDPPTSVSTVATNPDAKAPVTVISNRMDPMPGDTVDRLLEQFRRAYDEGNLIGLMALFTRDARNTAKDSKLLADDYRELFATSSARTLSLSDMSWWREGEQVVVIARFNAAITSSGRPRARRIGGDIRFELRREDGEVRIARIRHQVQ